MGRVTTRQKIVRLTGGERSTRVETLVVEEPLELRVGGESLMVTMRTPGDDFDLAAGFLVSEGVVTEAGDLSTMRFCAGADENGEQTYNLLDIVLGSGVAPPTAAAKRETTTTSACGVCGKTALDDVLTESFWSVEDDPLQISADTLAALPERLRAAQKLFDRTGGLHAAGLFTAEGELLASREDVGRHNAVDKVIGWALRQNLLPLRGTVLMVSGRASFELVQKAVMAGIPALAAVSAPSSLAVDLAAETGLTLAGFLRGDTVNLYARDDRVCY
ncbi:formate dehydrogenase accessory sulfurtransferase FdhD [Glycomyces sp. L485]|uniref:formate dehydrogenase accessory sulfurtransferase FdhD n=1 Tax=Glycomyces sp. L485 TaxID=2909235 RepID=UPI001F4B51F6|nr:formate dehydrogenase accessory sulfurtransferase FdhD [Glycomyces sp. L485]MCH7232818.1 formate dehydrogenase accessory sulfurtransferase FdhD [Glycomyces sp. L485]